MTTTTSRTSTPSRSAADLRKTKRRLAAAAAAQKADHARRILSVTDRFAEVIHREDILGENRQDANSNNRATSPAVETENWSIAAEDDDDNNEGTLVTKAESNKLTMARWNYHHSVYDGHCRLWRNFQL